MKPRLSVLCIPALGLALAAGSVSATGPRFEATPFVGYRLAGEFESPDPDRDIDVRDGQSLGLSLGWYRDAESFYELLYSRRKADLAGSGELSPADELSIEYLHFGGTLLFPQAGGQTGYFSLTAGLTRLDGGPGSYSAERKFSASLGGGIRFPLGERLDANLGLRAWYTFVDSSTELVCISVPGEAGCLVRSSSNGLWELEAMAGLTFRFDAR